MLEDVKIYTSPDKNSVEKFIMDMDEKWYFKAEFRTNIVYRSFQFSWDNQVIYTVVMTKYKDMHFENIPTEWLSTLSDNDNKDVIEISGEGQLPTVTEQVHSEEGGRGKKGKDSEKEMSTTSDSSSVHES